MDTAAEFVLRMRNVATDEVLELRPDADGVVWVPNGMFEPQGQPIRIPPGVSIRSERSRQEG
jgi:hypothetical protein